MDELKKYWESPVVSGVALCVASFVVLWIAGWRLCWGEFINTKETIYFGRGFAIQFNFKYYGLLFGDRFFNSPGAAWFLFGCAFTLFSSGLKSLAADAEASEETTK